MTQVNEVSSIETSLESFEPLLSILLRSPKDLNEIELILNKIESHFSNENYNMTLKCFGLPMKTLHRYLTLSLNICLKKGEEELLDRISFIFTRLAGWEASKEQEKKLTVYYEQELILIEPSFEEAELGWKTWPGGKLLACLLLHYQIQFNGNLLELGSGTGVAGFSSAKINLNCQHYLTDYNNAILKALEKSQQKNEFKNCHIQKLDWNWFKDDNEFKLNQSNLNFIPNNIQTILAADFIYSIEHGLLIPKVLNYYLSKVSIQNIPNLTTSNLKTILLLKICKAILFIPIRSTHKKDHLTFESELKSYLKVIYEETFDAPELENVEEFIKVLNQGKKDRTLKDWFNNKGNDLEVLGYKIYVVIKT